MSAYLAPEYKPRGMGIHVAECTFCGERQLTAATDPTPYCHNCGHTHFTLIGERHTLDCGDLTKGQILDLVADLRIHLGATNIKYHIKANSLTFLCNNL